MDPISGFDIRLVFTLPSSDSTLHTGHQSPELKTRYRSENQFKTRVSRMELGSFVNIDIFVMKYYFIQFVYILNLVSNLLIQNLHKC